MTAEVQAAKTGTILARAAQVTAMAARFAAHPEELPTLLVTAVGR